MTTSPEALREVAERLTEFESLSVETGAGYALQHVYGNASQSTLRRTLGVLLTETLDLTLALHNGRAHYGADGEARITRWMQENARVAWAVDPEPWVTEHELLASAVLALNIDGRSDDFVRSISSRRSAALAAAKA